jgi:hypothetical protein
MSVYKVGSDYYISRDKDSRWLTAFINPIVDTNANFILTIPIQSNPLKAQSSLSFDWNVNYGVMVQTLIQATSVTDFTLKLDVDINYQTSVIAASLMDAGNIDISIQYSSDIQSSVLMSSDLFLSSTHFLDTTISNSSNVDSDLIVDEPVANQALKTTGNVADMVLTAANLPQEGDHSVEYYVLINDHSGTNTDTWGTTDGSAYGRVKTNGDHRGFRGGSGNNYGNTNVSVGVEYFVQENLEGVNLTVLYYIGNTIDSTDVKAVSNGPGSPIEIGGRTGGVAGDIIIYDFKVYDAGHNLIHHWPLNGNTDDIVGGAHGTLQGSASFVEHTRQTGWG